jgi:hypothetical protein
MAERLPPSRRIGEDKRKPNTEKPLRPPARVAEVVNPELHELAQDLMDEWQCSGPLRLWKREELEDYVRRAADLSEMVLDTRKKC